MDRIGHIVLPIRLLVLPFTTFPVQTQAFSCLSSTSLLHSVSRLRGLVSGWTEASLIASPATCQSHSSKEPLPHTLFHHDMIATMSGSRIAAMPCHIHSAQGAVFENRRDLGLRYVEDLSSNFETVTSGWCGIEEEELLLLATRQLGSGGLSSSLVLLLLLLEGKVLPFANAYTSHKVAVSTASYCSASVLRGGLTSSSSSLFCFLGALRGLAFPP